MISVKLKAKKEEREEILSLTFSSKETELLEKYKENITRLLESRIFTTGIPYIKKITWTEINWLSFEFSEFEYGDICELLHRARPIFLSQEPASFERTCSVFGKQSKGTSLVEHLRYVRNLYKNGEYKPYYQISINETPLFDDNTLQTWLNGVEYHQDTEKIKIVKMLEESLTSEAARAIFICQLSGRLKASAMLADLVNLVFAKHHSS